MMGDRERIDKLRTVVCKGSLYDPQDLAGQLEQVARECDSSLHEVAAMCIRRLYRENRILECKLDRIRSEVESTSVFP